MNNFGPSILICLLISNLAYGLKTVERQLFTEAWLESLVLAILLGSITRSCFTLPQYFQKGITFCAKTLLEIAIVLLGASINIRVSTQFFQLVGVCLLASCLLSLSLF
ncbi:putative sulfate exporter family transporter [Bartonella rattaustraliani]|uniref:putative sulfate exporter family transporter n=1 Tax=Bartonella rattaustraliani TaxID=481139 RepID=UPI003CC751A3